VGSAIRRGARRYGLPEQNLQGGLRRKYRPFRLAADVVDRGGRIG
jgi:hypothetical protein